jgi:DUF1680 family protein
MHYNVDRLLAPYRKVAGLPKKAESYPNWSGLDGHIAGHYLSAMAMNYAATGNKECKRRMEYMLSELKEIQVANAINNAEWGVGYAGGFPNSENLWSAFVCFTTARPRHYYIDDEKLLTEDNTG